MTRAFLNREDVMAEERNQERRADADEQGAGEEARDETREVVNYTSNTPQRRSQQKVLLDPELGEDDGYPLGEQEALERVPAADNAEQVMDEMREATMDMEVLEDFAERQEMPADEQGLFRRLREHHDETPQLSAGDLDAAWDQADVGDETASAEPTPDKDIVDEIGAALGVTYDDDEELDFAEKVYRRDEERYELDLDSVEDNLEEQGLEEADMAAEDEAGAARAGEDEDGGGDEDDDPFELTTTDTRPD
jgi:hypothetical protein